MENPYINTQPAEQSSIADSRGQLQWDARRLSASCQEKQVWQQCNLCLAHPLGLLKYCDHTQAKNLLAWSFWYAPLWPIFFIKNYLKLYPQGCSKNLEIAMTNLERMRSVRVGGTRSVVLSFLSVQIICDIKNTFWDCKIHFPGCMEEKLVLTPCLTASVCDIPHLELSLNEESSNHLLSRHWTPG